MTTAIDLYAGAGGWDIAANLLGVDPLGIEIDEAACATREAAGFPTRQGDVASFDPAKIAAVGGFDLLLASPPCPSFSTAGKGDGLHDMPLVYEAAIAAANGKPVPELPWKDERSALVVEPLRWAILLEPRFLAWEQVPPVLPFWEHCAEILRRKGWNVWTGIMEAERYGVPQTRERAILMADREAPVHPPRPTHQRYVKGEAQRHEVTLEGEVLPWISMAEALGPEGERPSPAPTVSGGGTGAGGGVEVFASAESRKRLLEATQRNGSTGEYGERGEDEPSFTVAPNADRWKFRSDAQGNATVGDADEPAPTIKGGHCAWERVWFRNGNRENAAEREADEPAPTLHFGARSNKVDWVYDRRAQNSDGSPVPASRPAPTLTANGLAKATHQWVSDRPSTTVTGDPRISQPGRHDPEESGSQQKDAIRVTLEEAAVLQSFPPDFPFQGTKSRRFLQVGNAVPPALALPILGELLGLDWRPIHAEYLATYAVAAPDERAAA